MTDDYPTERRQPVPDTDPAKPDEQGEPFTIEPQLPTDEDGERIYPQDAPREGENSREPSTTGTIGGVNPII